MEEYKRKYSKDNINQFTDGGRINNGDKSATAAYAFYGEKDKFTEAKLLTGEHEPEGRASSDTKMHPRDYKKRWKRIKYNLF